jgi:hypothetical protein
MMPLLAFIGLTILTVFLVDLKYHSNYDESQSLSSLFYDKKSRLLQESVVKGKTKEQLFYMYDLEEKYWWRWPKNSTDCSKNKYIQHKYGQLSGIGPPIDPDNGLFMTWHFSLFSSLFNRLKRSSRRTRDPEKASLFIIPYDLALDGYTDPETCLNRNPLQCSRGYVNDLQQYLKQSKFFKRHNGADHAVLWSLHQYHALPRGKCDQFINRFCKLCTFTCYWMNYTQIDNRFVSIPFPSGYHWRDGIKNIPWDVQNAPNRNLTAVYIGSTRTITDAHTKIRQAMCRQCAVKNKCHWMKIFHSSTGIKLSQYFNQNKFFLDRQY